MILKVLLIRRILWADQREGVGYPERCKCEGTHAGQTMISIAIMISDTRSVMLTASCYMLIGSLAS